MKSKNIVSVFIFLILFTACKREDATKFLESIKSAKSTLVNSDTLVENSFNKTIFNDRAEELIYIREYLKYKLPLLLIKKDLDLVKKAQYTLIANGENPSSTDAAKRTIVYSNKYEGYMSLITSENMSFKEVKNQLESKGKIDFNLETLPTNFIRVKNETVNEEDTLNVVNSKSNYSFPNYLINLNHYSPKISGICEDQGYSDCFRDVTSFVKDLVDIRKTHLNNKYNEDYLSFYKTSNALKDNRSWGKDALDIDKYIVENIKRYDDAVKSCDCDDYDWFKKMPKDLYQYFNLNKKELLNSIEY
ncbi:hypothetical protein [Flavobacterium sp. 5]|uniref:hypothetical protein n=1 Tax=Flavobacterium sp. 5 TaxID=2035199 RepID=UPI0012FE76C2|nr:hypothetical protein [Flavobacterium sp. 5]